MTIVTQFLNHHDDIKIFDEIDLIQINRGPVSGTLAAFLHGRGVYDAYQHFARETDDPAVALRAIMNDLARPCTIWGEKNPRYAAQSEALRRTFPGAVVLFVLRDPREIVNSYLLHRDSPHARRRRLLDQGFRSRSPGAGAELPAAARGR